jgi:beta-N-acetylhexosaminidase
MRRRLFPAAALAGGVVILLLLVLAAAGCASPSKAASSSTRSGDPDAGPSPVSNTTTSEPQTTTTTTETRAKTLLKGMTLRQKAAQVLLLDFAGVETGSAQLRELLAESPPGGLMIMGRNVENPQQLKSLIAFMQGAAERGGSPVRLLIAVDQEGGTVQRIRDGVTAIPAARTLGATSTPDAAAEIATETAGELLALGVNMNLAPVADVVTKKGEFLYSRTYSGDPERVAAYVAAVTRAFTDEGLITVLKHFPGHGSASGDTHSAAVVSAATREQFENVHLAPFEAGVEAGAEGVMVAHIIAKAYDAKHPATSSEAVVEGLLRERLGFTGIVVTDALEMKAARVINGVVGTSTPEDVAQTAVSALNAGCDLLISTGTIAGQVLIVDRIVAAVKSGRLSLSRLNEAVLRILELKVRHGLETG